MITQRCKNPTCDREFTPDANHRFGGCCSAECAREHLRSTSRMPNARTWGKPNTSRTIIAPRFHSKQGTDNRKVSGE